MRYLSDEWKREQWKSFEEYVRDDSSCDGYTLDGPPCGGCGYCLRAQFAHSLMVEEKRVRTLLATGLGVADPGLIKIPMKWGSGQETGNHRGYDCFQTGERSDVFFPWARPMSAS